MFNRMRNNIPDTEVTEDEFIKAFIKSGKTEEEAKMQAHISKILGSSVLVGKKMLKIKNKVDNQ